MTKYIQIILVLALAFTGCTAERIAVKKPKERQQLSDSEKKQFALSHFINGTLFDANDQFVEAIAEYKWALALDPSSGINYSIAKDLNILGKHTEALVFANNAVKMDSLNESYLDLLCDIYLANNVTDSAISIYKFWLSKDSTSLIPNYKLAKLYEDLKPLSAIEIYNRIIDNEGPVWDVLVRLAGLYEKTNKLNDAISVTKKIKEAYPSEISISRVLIELLEKNNELDSAISVCNELIELSPNDLSLREIKAGLNIGMGNWKVAAEEYNFILNSTEINFQNKLKIGAAYFSQTFKDSTLIPITKNIFLNIDKDTTAWEVKLFLGSIAVSLKEYDSAYKNYKLVTELAAWNIEGWNRLGGIYYETKKYSEAVELLNTAIKLFPEEYSINFLLGISLAQCNNHKDAKSFLLKSVELNPNDINTLSAYSYTLSSLKESDSAIVYLNKALQIEPTDVNLLGTLGLIYNGMKKFIECDSVYQKALSIEPTNALVNNNYAYSLSERGIELKKALKMIEIALKAEPNNSSYIDTEGWIYFKLGNLQKAEKTIRKAIEIGGEKPALYDHLGDILSKQGKTSEAFETWKKAYQLDNSNEEIKQKIEEGVK